MKKRSGFGWMELIIGILLVLLGIMSILRPGSILTWVVVIYGLVAILTGIADIIFYCKMDQFTGFGPTISLISGILSVMTGFMLLVHPGAGKWALAVLFPIWFMAHCISRLSHLTFIHRLTGPGSYYFTLISNIIGIVLAFIMLLMPDITYLSLGIIIGVWLILLGIDSIILGAGKIGSGW